MYGDNATRLRNGLGELLRHHRINQRLGGLGAHTVPESTTLEERAQLAGRIRTYRQAVLVWCRDTATAIDPYVVSNVRHLPANPFIGADRELAPLDSLKHALEFTTRHSTAALPALQLLTTKQEFPLVETWRQIARAAALAEHDINPAPGTRPLTVAQALTVAADVAAVSQALVVLDKRYLDLPGWEKLQGAHQLGWAALACALDAGLGAPDLSVDEHGWQPNARPMRGAVRPGYLGVLQAEHNLLIKLASRPNVLNLRRIVDSQRLLSAELAVHADRVDPATGDRWRARSNSYRLLQRQLREIGGLTGSGGPAAAHGGAAVSRLRATASTARLEPRMIKALATVFARVDEQIADHIDTSIRERRYFERTTLATLSEAPTGLVRPAQERYQPISETTQRRLTALTRHRLRHAAPATEGTTPAALSRAELQAALLHRPPPRQADPPMSR